MTTLDLESGLDLEQLAAGHCDHHDRDFMCPTCKAESTPPKPKQTARMIGCQCVACGFTFRASRRWLLDSEGKVKVLACPDVECGGDLLVSAEDLKKAGVTVEPTEPEATEPGVTVEPTEPEAEDGGAEDEGGKSDAEYIPERKNEIPKATGGRLHGGMGG